MTSSSVDISSIEQVIWERTHALFVAGDILVQLWERESPADAFRAILQRCERWKLEQPARPLWMLSVVSEQTSMPTEEGRRIAAKFPSFFSAFVMVVEGSGFRSSLVRSVLTGMSLLSSKKTKAHVSSTVPQGCALLSELSGGAFDGATLAAQIAAVRSELAR